MFVPVAFKRFQQNTLKEMTSDCGKQGEFSLMEERTFETGLGKMDRVLTGRTYRGGNSRKCELHKQALEAGKYTAFLEKSSNFHLAETLGNEE